ncbi:MAG: hypothetical protein WC623_22570 [Pedobacter sp.]|uniref:hypothetical protein n=1 Tax=Pedobacter sp. TaxID=1411316 RepID=UPI0035652164
MKILEHVTKDWQKPVEIKKRNELKMSTRKIAIELKKLAEDGLLEKRKQNNRLFYRLKIEKMKEENVNVIKDQYRDKIPEKNDQDKIPEKSVQDKIVPEVDTIFDDLREVVSGTREILTAIHEWKTVVVKLKNEVLDLKDEVMKTDAKMFSDILDKERSVKKGILS